MSGSPSNQQPGGINRLRDHEYDGIREYDNALPRWWVWLFNFTIVFAAVYLVYFHLMGGGSLQQTLKEDLAEVAASTPAQPAGGGGGGTNFNDAALAAQGKGDFLTTCAPCHGEAGQGTIGPNLTDKFWIHGGAPEAIYNSIANGIVDEGMPAWKPVLGDDKVKAITAFVVSIKNTNAPGGKAPQGNEEQ